MKYLLKIFIFLTPLFCVKQISAQVTGVQYTIVYNSSTNLFDCFLYVAEGKASSTRERVQFNAQYSIIVPTGAIVSIEHTNMPLVDNQNFSGIQPIEWGISSKLTSPAIHPELDFYGISPSLAPAGFYNEISKGDFIKLFSLKVEGENIDANQVRIFNNETDPKSSELGMLSADFSNGFTMGGFYQLYRGIRNMNQDEAN